MTAQLGIFARIFHRASAHEVAEAVAEAGFHVTQLNLSSLGFPTVPSPDMDIDLDAIRGAFSSNAVDIWGLSATYNVIHPAAARRLSDTTKAQALIARSGQLGTSFVTLCTGSRDPQNMWRHHPSNDTEEAWRNLRASLDMLLPVAETVGVRLGIEPEPANVIADAQRAKRLLTELGDDARLVGIVFDPANLVSLAHIDEQEAILRRAFEELGDQIVAFHAKDIGLDGDYIEAGAGLLDYDLILALHATLPSVVPVIIQDADEADVRRVRDFLVSHVAHLV